MRYTLHTTLDSTVAAKLAALAQAEFGHLKNAEVALLRAAAAGKWAYYHADRHEWMSTDASPPKVEAPVNLPEFSENGDIGRKLQPWGPQRNVCARLIRWRCVSPAAKTLVDPLGVRLRGARVVVMDVSGPRSTLLFAAGSVDQKNTYVFQVTASAVSESVGTSVSYWSTGNGDDTMVTLWNPADETQDLLFTLMFSGGHYGYPVHLDPRATRTFNISEVIRAQVPDSEGNVVPLSVREGSASLTGTKGKAESILVAMEVGTYNLQKATCGNYCVNCSGSIATFIDPNNGDVAVATSMQLTYTSMHDDNFYYDITSATSWSSSDTSIASMNGSSVTGVSPGTAQITASDPYEPVYVSDCGYQVPYDCSAFYGVSTYAPVNAICAKPYNFRQTSGTGSGGTLTFAYAWSSTDGVGSHLAACVIGEYVAYPGALDPYYPPVPPFPDTISFRNPTTGPPVEVPGTDLGAMDTHSTPGTFATPFPIGITQFVATQYYYYKCSCTNGGLPVQIYPASGNMNITRSVNATSSTSGTFTITKSGVSSSKAVP